jgi:hypothetical protein
LRCGVCTRNPPDGRTSDDAYRELYWLGFARTTKAGNTKREVIHLLCGRRFWTNHGNVPHLDLYSLAKKQVVPKGTRLADLL